VSEGGDHVWPLIHIGTYTIKSGKLEECKQRPGELVDLVETNEPRLIAFHIYLGEQGSMIGSMRSDVRPAHRVSTNRPSSMALLGVGRRRRPIDGRSIRRMHSYAAKRGALPEAGHIRGMISEASSASHMIAAAGVTCRPE
jgi:hypothetical protein